MDIREIFLTILDIVMTLAIPIVLFFIILGGFLYVTARGDATQIERATKSLVYGIIGGVIIVGARALFEIVENTINLFG